MKLYVGNIPFSATEADLRALFDPTPLDRITICTDRDSGRPKGFAFVEVADANRAKEAVAGLDGSDLGGRRVKISQAVERADRRGPPSRSSTKVSVQGRKKKLGSDKRHRRDRDK